MWNWQQYKNTWCGSKVMRLATLCMNRQCCCLPLHMAVRRTPAVDSVQVWTCYSCYAIVESVCVCEVRYENGPAKVWATLCHQILCKAWRIRYCDLWKVTKDLWRTFSIHGTSVQMAQVLFRRPRTVKTNLMREDLQPQKRTTMWKKWSFLWGQIIDWRWEWSVVS